ncbi:hypothetical protein D9613_008040 [Agrocybe pediades]|uniref:Uncharacterized protein n=1 Tax=Agrocybe pediades TaxID=84607 RepID=A0A8H4QNW8_9AGAR|nr:hypothetical protein D9613_008040 [Agrocybe pediades]KAF9558848.1 hypothetical protein CPC08DRAFT_763704 [Agrocybe pediades]
MSTAANSYYFRRRTIGRAASPPTWACYEQIQDDYSNSESESCSEDDDDYHEVGSRGGARQDSSDSEEGEITPAAHADVAMRSQEDDGHDIDMDMDEDDGGKDGQGAKDTTSDKPKDVKGKQRAIEPEPESPRRQRKKRQHVVTLRPILTIQKSQGFVWNQDLFVPPYIKDRYIASTSPPNSRGFISSSVSSNNSAMTDYEVEVVEIRVKEGDLDDIIP